MGHNAGIGIGYVPLFLLGAILPESDDKQGNKDDELWRVIYMIPAVIAII